MEQKPGQNGRFDIEHGRMTWLFKYKFSHGSGEDIWLTVVKQIVGRYARGNTSAQEGHILLPEEQAAERIRAKKILDEWAACSKR